MARNPTSARGSRPLPLAELGGDLGATPFTARSRAGSRNASKGRFVQSPVPAAKQPSPLQPAVWASRRPSSERAKAVYRSQQDELLRTAEQSQLRGLERGFNLNFSSTRKNSAPAARGQDGQKPMPLLARKVLQACHAAANDAHLTALLGPTTASSSSSKQQQPARGVGRRPSLPLALFDEVEVRDKDDEDWHLGLVTQLNPTKVRLVGWDQAFSWNQLRRSSQEESRCPCGFIFIDGGLFCSACGRRRDDECNNAATVAMGSRGVGSAGGGAGQHEAAGAASGCAAARHSKGGCTEAYGWEQQTVQVLGHDGALHRLSPPKGAEVDANADEFDPFSGCSLERTASPQACVGQERANSGSDASSPSLTSSTSRALYGGLHSLGPSDHGCWEQRTVPIVSQNGSLHAIRPQARSRVVAAQGLVKQPPQQSQWQQHTVPIVGENGQVHALRPKGREAEDAQGAKWEQATVPILGEDGEFLAIRPSGQRYDMPAWRAEALRPRPPAAAAAVGGRSAQPVLSAASEEVTLYPAAVVGSPVAAAAADAQGPDGGRSLIASGPPTLGTSLLPIPSCGCSDISSLAVVNVDVVSSGGESRGLPDIGTSEHTGLPFAPPSDAASMPTLGTSLLPLPSDAGSLQQLGHSDSLASVLLSPARGCGLSVRTASTDSMRTIDEIIRLANRNRAATPDGHTLECLQDMLRGSKYSLDGLGASLFDEAPGADELASRLRQLPDLWRTTIMQMLEQAESVQKGVETYEDADYDALAAKFK
eukprot:TRINITY_DN28494_c0_g2_i1.p1 TRINITY_DN28494_c0_g2~~TRINITY_DN28494_c0_g2_i1.p1  ORF type:complete len:765 (+),score=152.90 TRINITY_DN28494_c0_g2_i1:83-2377(+)